MKLKAGDEVVFGRYTGVDRGIEFINGVCTGETGAGTYVIKYFEIIHIKAAAIKVMKKEEEIKADMIYKKFIQF